MKRILPALFLALTLSSCCRIEKAANPVIFADVPDMSMIRVGDTYYMSSTTMHMAPGVPIMKSTDLVNWEIVSYCYERLDECDAMCLDNGQSTYGKGTWASSIRYHEGKYYVSTFANTTHKNYLFVTDDIENGQWTRYEYEPMCHDHSLFFDDASGKIYLIWSVGRIFIQELEPDFSGLVEGTRRVLIEDVSAPAKAPMSLRGEGSQMFKRGDWYYLFNICWPRGGVRTVTVHRSNSLEGPWEGRVALQDRGIAQGGMVDTPDGRWFAYLFRDYGSVGRIPYLVEMTWEDEWPVLGVKDGLEPDDKGLRICDNVAPDILDLPAARGLKPGIVADDSFDRKEGDRLLPLVWQWNHNPADSLWSLTERPGWMRLRSGRVDEGFLQARNTLTQRTAGPACEGQTKLDVSGLREGDMAGLSLLQRDFGQLAVTVSGGKKYLQMINAEHDSPTLIESVELTQDEVWLRADCDFRDRADQVVFFYSLNGTDWLPVGNTLHMVYSMPHFMGYRFGLFMYSTLSPGGYADFDHFHININE